MVVHDLPSGLSMRLDELKGQLAELSKPYTEKRQVTHPLTLKQHDVDVDVVPRVNLTVQMNQAGVVQLIAQRVKPMERPFLLAEFHGEDFMALQKAVHHAELSWEAFFVGVLND